MGEQSYSPLTVMQEYRQRVQHATNRKLTHLASAVRAVHEVLVPEYEAQFGWSENSDPGERARQDSERLRTAIDPDEPARKVSACLLLAYVGGIKEVVPGLHLSFLNDLLRPIGVRCYDAADESPAGDQRCAGGVMRAAGAAINDAAEMLADGQLDEKDSHLRKRTLDDLDALIAAARSMRDQVERRVPAARRGDK